MAATGSQTWDSSSLIMWDYRHSQAVRDSEVEGCDEDDEQGKGLRGGLRGVHIDQDMSVENRGACPPRER